MEKPVQRGGRWGLCRVFPSGIWNWLLAEGGGRTLWIVAGCVFSQGFTNPGGILWEMPVPEGGR